MVFFIIYSPESLNLLNFFVAGIWTIDQLNWKGVWLISILLVFKLCLGMIWRYCFLLYLSWQTLFVFHSVAVEQLYQIDETDITKNSEDTWWLLDCFSLLLICFTAWFFFPCLGLRFLRFLTEIEICTHEDHYKGFLLTADYSSVFEVEELWLPSLLPPTHTSLPIFCCMCSALDGCC